MGKYVSTEQVDAFQWKSSIAPSQMPPWVLGLEWRWDREAKGIAISVPTGEVTAREGNWILWTARGEVRICTEQHFTENYKQAQP